MELLRLKEAAHARLGLHLSKYHIVGNHIGRLILHVTLIKASHTYKQEQKKKQPGSQIIFCFVLNSTEHEISTAHMVWEPEGHTVLLLRIHCRCHFHIYCGLSNDMHNHPRKKLSQSMLSGVKSYGTQCFHQWSLT